MASLTLAQAFRELGDVGRAVRVENCSTYLTFKELPSGQRKLALADFCRERLCATCQWRKSLRTHYDVSRIIEFLGPQFRYIFLTLTVPNCRPSDLSKTLDNLQDAWKRFSNTRPVKRAFMGSFRSLEIKHNLTRDDYHPHLHVLVAVKPSYFRGPNFISNRPVYRYDGQAYDFPPQPWLIRRGDSQLVELWRAALRADGRDAVVCDLRRVRGHTAKAVAEVAKYAVKPDEVIVEGAWQFTLATVSVLHEALAGRRLVSYSGVMKKAKAELCIADADDADLVRVDGDSDDETVSGTERTFRWYSVYNQYLG